MFQIYAFCIFFRTFAETEEDAVYYRNDSRALIYEVVDEKMRIFGNYGGWRVIAFPGINPLHHVRLVMLEYFPRKICDFVFLGFRALQRTRSLGKVQNFGNCT